MLNEEDFYGKTPPGSSDFFIFCRGKFSSSTIYRNLLNKFEKGSWAGTPETTGRQRERQFLQGAGSWYGTRLAGKRRMSLIPQAIAAGRYRHTPGTWAATQGRGMGHSSMTSPGQGGKLCRPCVSSIYKDGQGLPAAGQLGKDRQKESRREPAHRKSGDRLAALRPCLPGRRTDPDKSLGEDGRSRGKGALFKRPPSPGPKSDVS